MRILGAITVIFYTVICLFIGGFLIAVSFDVLTIEQIKYLFDMYNLKIISGISGVGLIVISLFLTQMTFGKLRREKTIAFNNPDGQVIISLSAIEDFIKRIGKQIPEVKDLRPDVIATKKGIDVSVRISLWSEVSIPEITEKIQGIIKNRVQEMLGIEEPVSTKVYVVKIVHKEEVPLIKKQEQTNIPYRNF